MGKGTSCQPKQPEFHPQIPHIGRSKLVLWPPYICNVCVGWGGRPPHQYSPTQINKCKNNGTCYFYVLICPCTCTCLGKGSVFLSCPSPLFFETGFSRSWSSLTDLVGQWASGTLLSVTPWSWVCVRMLPHWLLTWMLGIWTQVLPLVRQSFYWWNHLKTNTIMA